MHKENNQNELSIPDSDEVLSKRIQAELANTGRNACIDYVYQILTDRHTKKRACEILGYALWSLELGISTTVAEAIANGKIENGIN